MSFTVVIICSGLQNERNTMQLQLQSWKEDMYAWLLFLKYLVAGFKINTIFFRKSKYASGTRSVWKQSTFLGVSDLFSLLVWLFGVFFVFFFCSSVCNFVVLEEKSGFNSVAR